MDKRAFERFTNMIPAVLNTSPRNGVNGVFEGTLRDIGAGGLSLTVLMETPQPFGPVRQGKVRIDRRPGLSPIEETFSVAWKRAVQPGEVVLGVEFDQVRPEIAASIETHERVVVWL